MDRRKFIAATAAVAATRRIAFGTQDITKDDVIAKKRPIVVATWPFGKPACELAIKTMRDSTMLDGIEHGIRLVESDESNPSVGIGGIPNADGVVELDACIMSGPNHTAGSVAGLQDILHPISVAKRVMEKTKHVLLVGEGARKFAVGEGFKPQELLTDGQRKNWQVWLEKNNAPPPIDENHHDTIAMIGVDGKGDIYGGCSTSGWGYKLAGRVGDSPIIGSGLYVDNKVGAAGATGVGENVMRYCASFMIVEFMRNGMGPTAACAQAIRRIADLDPKRIDELDINFIAINKSGEYGAAGTSRGFQFAIATDDESKVVAAKSLSKKAIGPDGGNRK